MDMSGAAVRFYLPLLVGICLMTAIYLLISQFVYVDQALRSKHWEPVEARVVTWREAQLLGAKYDAIDAVLTSMFLPAFFSLPRLPFSFNHSGTTYSAVNYTYSIDPLGPKQSQVDGMHPAGSRLVVYYDPADPRNAVVKPGLNEHFYVVIFGAAFLIALCIYLLTRPNPDNAV